MSSEQDLNRRIPLESKLTPLENTFRIFLRKFRKLIDCIVLFLYPADPHLNDGSPSQDVRRARICILFSFIFASCGLLFAPLYFHYGSPIAGSLIVICDVLILLSWFILKWSLSPSLATHWTVFQVYWLLAALAFLNGGLSGPSLAWSISLPIAATLMAGPRVGYLWTALVTLKLIFFFVLGILQFPFPQQLTASQIHFLYFVSLVSLACLIQLLASLYESLISRDMKNIEDLSITDHLTDLLNRRGFYKMLSRQMERAREYKRDLILIFADLDGLKHANDQYGHAEGDFLLKGAAEVLRQALRADDVIARLGGDEFTIVLLEFPSYLNISRRVADASSVWNDLHKRPIPLSLSLGFEKLDPNKPATIIEKLNSADKQMYAQKESKK